MSLRSIFNCCNGFSFVQEAEGTYASTIRNNRVKNNKLSCLNSHKASLKPRSSFKSSTDDCSARQSSRIQRISSTDSVNSLSPAIPKSVAPHLLGPERNFQAKTKMETYLSPIMNNQPNRTSESEKQKANFLYSNLSKNMEYRLSLPNTPSKSLGDQNEKNFVGKEKTWQQVQSFRKKQNSKIKTQSKKQANEYKTQQQKPIPTKSINPVIKSLLNLEGSKITVFSKEQIEEVLLDLHEIEMEESTIIMNVFNPSQSQIQNWQLYDSTTYFLKKSIQQRIQGIKVL